MAFVADEKMEKADETSEETGKDNVRNEISDEKDNVRNEISDETDKFFHLQQMPYIYKKRELQES
jgi:hypothetical protein